MGKNDNVKCVVCGRGYHLCMSCKDKLSMKPWKVLTDTAEHYKVHQIVNGYRGGIYTKDEARVALANVDISDKHTYLYSVRKILNEILKQDIKVEKKIQKVQPKVNVTDKIINYSDNKNKEVK